MYRPFVLVRTISFQEQALADILHGRTVANSKQATMPASSTSNIPADIPIFNTTESRHGACSPSVSCNASTDPHNISIDFSDVLYTAPKYDIQWGPNPRQKCDDWLTFKYDKATYFHDTSGTLWKHIYDDSAVESYYSKHNGKSLTSENIEDLDAILSCEMYCGKPDDSIFASLTNPEHLVTFTKGNRVTGYISADFYSGQIHAIPETESKELCALKYFFQTVRRQ